MQTAEIALREAIKLLVKAGVPGAARDARILLADTMGCDAGALPAELDRMLDASEGKKFFNRIASRCQRQPMAQILGRREFWGHVFQVTSNVLDPRPETETIVELALENTEPERLLDLGTGSGCLVVSLLLEWRHATAVATDISASALLIAQANARDAGVADRVDFVQADWFDGVEGKFDLAVCNPPYVTAAEYSDLEDDVRRWEPKEAITTGGDGLAAYRTVASGLSRHLRGNARALFEIGHHQANDVKSILTVAGFPETRLHKDLGGSDRVIEACQSSTISGRK